MNIAIVARLATVGLLLQAAACHGRAEPARDPSASAYRYQAPPTLADGWQTASAADQGIDPAGLERMTDTIRATPSLNIHAILIERGGRLVYEEYFSGEDQRWGDSLGKVTFDRDTKHDLRSVTKSVVSALVGIASSSGAIASLDTALVDYFPEYRDLQTPDRRRITLRHTMSMSAGLEWNEEVPYTDPRNDEIVMTRSAEPLRYALGRPIVTAPGTVWRYNGGLTQVLAAVLQRTTKTPLVDFARRELFGPLGIEDFEWVGDLAGIPAAASGLRLRPRDLAKFGSLYLTDGKWNGRQVLPPGWAEESTRRRLTFPGEGDEGYGYQWWHFCLTTPAGPLESRTAVGNGDQRIFVLPALDMVVTVLAGRYNDFSKSPARDLVRGYILPSVSGPKPAASCPR